jgi:hypothetical protein
MKLKVKLNNITRNLKTNKPIISFEVLDNITSLEEIENASELDLEVNKHKNKRRSLDSNRLCVGINWENTKQIKYT